MENNPAPHVHALDPTAEDAPAGQEVHTPMVEKVPAAQVEAVVREDM